MSHFFSQMPNSNDTHSNALMSAFGRELKRLRHEKGISQQKLADTFELRRTTITNYETGKSLPNLELFVEIVKFFGASSDVMLGLSNAEDMAHIKPKQSSPSHYITSRSRVHAMRRPELTMRTPEEQAHIVQLESKVDDLLKVAGQLGEELQKIRSAGY
jgi:DNA-binding XRE family transcriptional regulator